MAQFDVHRNPGGTRAAIPFVVVVQSASFSDFKRRVVVPLVRRSHVGAVHHDGFNPGFVIEGIAVVLHPLELVSVPLAALGEPVASLAAEGDLIIGALDELLSRAYG